MRNLKQELVTIRATDGVLLPAMFYKPMKKSRKALIWLHGNGSSSFTREVEALKIMAEELAKKKISCLALNNRGAHQVNRLKVAGHSQKRVLAGTAYEKIKDCIKDIDGAIKFVKQRGYKEFYLIGHSTGANKICVYDYYKKNNPISKYVLVGGADDSGIYYNEFGKQKFWQLLKESKRKIRQKKGSELVAYEKIKGRIFSNQSLYDIMNPDGAYNTFPFHYYFHKLTMGKKKLFKEFSAIKKPALIIYGEKDEYCYGRVGEIVKVLHDQIKYKANKKFYIFKNGDHGLHGHEKKLARAVGQWL